MSDRLRVWLRQTRLFDRRKLCNFYQRRMVDASIAVEAMTTEDIEDKIASWLKDKGLSYLPVNFFPVPPDAVISSATIRLYGEAEEVAQPIVTVTQAVENSALHPEDYNDCGEGRTDE